MKYEEFVASFSLFASWRTYDKSTGLGNEIRIIPIAPCREVKSYQNIRPKIGDKAAFYDKFGLCLNSESIKLFENKS